MDLKEFFDNLSEELKEKFRNCKTKEEMTALLKEENIELDDETIEGLSGGDLGVCPKVGICNNIENAIHHKCKPKYF